MGREHGGEQLQIAGQVLGRLEAQGHDLAGGVVDGTQQRAPRATPSEPLMRRPVEQQHRAAATPALAPRPVLRCASPPLRGVSGLDPQRAYRLTAARHPVPLHVQLVSVGVVESVERTVEQLLDPLSFRLAHPAVRCFASALVDRARWSLQDHSFPQPDELTRAQSQLSGSL